MVIISTEFDYREFLLKTYSALSGIKKHYENKCTEVLKI